MHVTGMLANVHWLAAASIHDASTLPSRSAPRRGHPPLRAQRHPGTSEPVTRRRLDHTASFTAQVNAAQRAAEMLQPGERRLLDDPYARNLVRHLALRALIAHSVIARAAIAILDRLYGGLHAHIILRARYADDERDAALAVGIDQIVLLGAGFDTTALRTHTAGSTVYEVDAPATQHAKRVVLEDLSDSAVRDRIVWVPCDFEHDSLRERLLDSGFDPTRPALVVWFGVTLYLSRSAIETTLADVASICAAGSRLILDYTDPDVVTGTSLTPGRGAPPDPWPGTPSPTAPGSPPLIWTPCCVPTASSPARTFACPNCSITTTRTCAVDFAPPTGWPPPAPTAPDPARPSPARKRRPDHHRLHDAAPSLRPEGYSPIRCRDFPVRQSTSGIRAKGASATVTVVE